MALQKLIVILDWRLYGDFSAVGQLTQKIFNEYRVCRIISIKVSNDGNDCTIYEVLEDKPFKEILKNARHDSVQSYLKPFEKDIIFYLRLSPCKNLLDLAVKLKIGFTSSKFISHHMDQPDLRGFTNSKAEIIRQQYRFLLRYSDLALTIHESNKAFLEKEYFREFKVLGNFVNIELFNKNKVENNLINLKSEYRIAYFGTIDEKMNYDSLVKFSKAISNNNLIKFDIFTGSGLPGEMKDIVGKSRNIKRHFSNLSIDEYKKELVSSDFLLLPYNSSAKDINFLSQSFSNKLIDYIESGRQILVVGPKGIPTIDFCVEYSVGIHMLSCDENEIKKLFESHSRIKNILNVFYTEKLKLYLESKFNNLAVFHEELDVLSSNDKFKEPCLNTTFIPRNVALLLKLLIKSKLMDKLSGEQSLSSSILLSLLKKNGYQGIYYEI